MSVLQRVSDHLRVRRLWSRVDSLAEWGELTAQWLEGTVPWHPAYPGDGPDPETHEIAETLAVLNRCGLVTTQSQPGCRDECECCGQCDSQWVQRAAVTGACQRWGDYASLRDACLAAGLWVNVGAWTTVTVVDGRDYTEFGGPVSRRDLRSMFEGASRQVMREVYDAIQVTVIEPDWDRNDRLWPVLAQWADNRKTVRSL